ncbi:MAG TPA: hypothetical protein VHW44_24345 [Pseudonocardiaceae bacterium]|nr:hypothetical protein [Pseudonocardiaceae bacterium]
MDLDAVQLGTLGRGLYRMLSLVDGYLAAKVGWDPEGFVGLAELRLDWTDELAPGELPGLVLSTSARQQLPPPTGFQPFGNDCEWIPYRGEQAANHS